jgi:hypothetical protein
MYAIMYVQRWRQTICHNPYVLDVDPIKALASEKRLQVLDWLHGEGGTGQ